MKPDNFEKIKELMSEIKNIDYKLCLYKPGNYSISICRDRCYVEQIDTDCTNINRAADAFIDSLIKGYQAERLKLVKKLESL